MKGIRQELVDHIDTSPRSMVTASGTARALRVGSTAAVMLVAAHALANLISPYGFQRDEFLYFAMGEHLRLFAMDFPPFIALAARLARTFGDSLAMIRLLPALTAGAIVVLTVLISAEAGGGRRAQIVAALCVAASPLYMRAGNLFQPTVFDQLWWTLALYALVRLSFRATPTVRDWVLLGIGCGLGLLTKFTILVLGAGIFVALLMTPLRHAFRTRGPWISLLIALLLGSPSILGQINLGFPVLQQMNDLQSVQLVHVSAGSFLMTQVLMFGPACVIAMIAIWRAIRVVPMRAPVIACVVSFSIILLAHGKAYYAGPAFPALFGLGTGGAGARARASFSAYSLYALIVLYGLISLPLGLPVLPPAAMAKYAARLGVTAATTTNTGAVLQLPQDYADMLGWRQQVQTVARVFASLPPGDRAQAIVLASNYGEAGALDFYGPHLGLPPAVAPVGSYWFFGPGEKPGNVAVVVGSTQTELLRFFRSVSLAAVVREPWVVPEEQNLPVWIARQPFAPIQQVWPQFRGQN